MLNAKPLSLSRIALDIFIVALVAGDEFLIRADEPAFVVLGECLCDETDRCLCEPIGNRLLSDFRGLLLDAFQSQGSRVLDRLPLALLIRGQV